MCIGLWKIWQARNKVVFQQQVSDPQALAQDKWDSIMEFNMITKIGMHKMNALQNVFSVCGFWIIQSDEACFSEGIVS